jgi:hypothetical protein
MKTETGKTKQKEGKFENRGSSRQRPACFYTKSTTKTDWRMSPFSHDVGDILLKPLMTCLGCA